MIDEFDSALTKSFGTIYKTVLKPLFFLFDPEKVHNGITSVGVVLGKFKVTRFFIKILFYYDHPSLSQKIRGIQFKNPIGLAAGFDKNAVLPDILPNVGFGFEEVGSITAKPCMGNQGKRLYRLKKSQSLVVHYGLKNDGSQIIHKRLSKKKHVFPIGISIAKTNCKDTASLENGINDYVFSYNLFRDIGDYITLNISCPNAYGGQPFTDKVSYERLLKSLKIKKTDKPVFVKLSPDLSKKEVDDILQISKQYSIAGFICSNLTKNRNNKAIIEKTIPIPGGISGKVVEKLSNDLISYVYKKTKGSFVIIGCGGVFSAEDAYEKIKRGASLIQLITGMIFEGPQLIAEINQGLVKLLKKDGYSTIKEAVGVSSL
jgi:dihydroorotate dehydrogenase